MTKEEALSKVKGYLTNLLPFEEYGEVEEIIKALEQEPCEENIIDDHYWKGFHNGIRTEKFRQSKEETCEDCISREQVLSDYADWYGYGYDDAFYKRLKSMSSVTPTRKKGKWIYNEERSDLDYEVYTCSECGREVVIMFDGMSLHKDFPYCHCGAEMEGEGW